MPYVAPEGALNLRAVDLAALRREAGAPPWRRPLAGTSATRWVLSEWPAGFTAPAHHHPYADEAFLVLEGRADFRFDDAPDVIAAGPGTFLVAPRGLAHQIAVPGPEPLLLLVSVTPNEDRADETIEAPLSNLPG
jgi:mannose-6-phosphate isomerase-like protein (cupin superfamily)